MAFCPIPPGVVYLHGYSIHRSAQTTMQVPCSSSAQGNTRKSCLERNGTRWPDQPTVFHAQTTEICAHHGTETQAACWHRGSCSSRRAIRIPTCQRTPAQISFSLGPPFASARLRHEQSRAKESSSSFRVARSTQRTTKVDHSSHCEGTREEEAAADRDAWTYRS